MPHIRRSSRIQSNKTSVKKERSIPNNPSPANPKTKVKINTKLKPGICFACEQKHPPIRRYNVVEWAQCDNCDQWWHAECACITAEDCVRLAFYDISFTCALCCLKGSPWVLENHSIPVVNSTVFDSGQKNKTELVERVKKVTQVVEESKSSNKSSNIIVVDNIKDGQHWKSSKNIKEKLNQTQELKNIDFAYSLPKGGIALHCNTDEEAEKLLTNWPEAVFNEQEIPHLPKGNSLCSTGYLKNIDIKIKENQLVEFFKNKGCQVQQVKRVFHRHSGNPMPIRKVSFVSNQDLLKACSLVYPYQLNGKPAFCEEEKRLKIVRCFNCHQFNHISANCPNRTTCENCGSEDHTYSEQCHLQSICANCKGSHKSSSKFCPKYIHLLENIRKNNMC